MDNNLTNNNFSVGEKTGGLHAISGQIPSYSGGDDKLQLSSDEKTRGSSEISGKIPIYSRGNKGHGLGLTKTTTTPRKPGQCKFAARVAPWKFDREKS